MSLGATRLTLGSKLLILPLHFPLFNVFIPWENVILSVSLLQFNFKVCCSAELLHAVFILNRAWLFSECSKWLSPFRISSSPTHAPIVTTIGHLRCWSTPWSSRCIFLRYNTAMLPALFCSQNPLPFYWRFKLCRGHTLVWLASGVIIELLLRILTFGFERCWGLKPTSSWHHVLLRAHKGCWMVHFSIGFASKATSPESKGSSWGATH